jgi:NADP-dependent 3-hydroxy acid dehydrogenase YdfG
MSDEVRGRTALVTGASRGIGRRVAERLAESGARVWALARSEDALADLERESGCVPLPVDLTDDAAVWTAMDGLMEEIGGAPTIVVNAAGVFGIAPCAKETVSAFDRSLAVNLRGPFLIVRCLLPAMLERQDGLIVNVGSVAGRRALPGNAAYSAAKFGLRGFHEVLLEETRGTGVRATLLEPAATDTPLWDPLDPDADPNLPNRAEMLNVDDVAETVMFLATRPASVRIPLLQIEHG